MRCLEAPVPNRSRATVRIWALAFSAAGLALSQANPIDWPMLGFVPVSTNAFTEPVVIAQAGDSSARLFIVEQPGRIWIVQSNNVLAQPFINISNRVLSADAEQGLLGLAFPPGFSTNRHFYVDYTRRNDGAVTISRFFLSSTNSNVADPNSEQVILTIPKPYANHNGGQIAFGPDGYLYIGVGDGGSEGDPLNNGQNTSTLLGKLLRIGVESGISTYSVPAGNPFVGVTNYAPEIWAYGLRNPWRFSFDRLTGDLYIGDAGQDHFEEIDFQPAGSAGGQNYGWRIMEGPATYNVPSGFTNFASLTPPAVYYSHAMLPPYYGAVVTGGYVDRGPNAARLSGMYFFADFEEGWVWGMKMDGTNWQSQVLVHTNFTPSTFGEDEQGTLYLTSYYDGRIYQIQDTGQVWPPTVSPAGGTLNSNIVTTGCLTTNAMIHFTTNGLDPTESDPGVLAGGTIQVSNGTTNKLRAFRADLLPSAVVSAVFTLQVGTPSFNPAQGPITNGTQITMSTVTPGAVIHYTLNSNTPTIHSPAYSGPITINGDSTVEALATADGYNDSAIQNVFYALLQAAVPTFTPAQGPLTNGALISMNCSTPNATIRYTLDGTDPDKNSTRYSSPITFSGTVTVKARAFAQQYDPSDIATVTYGLLSYERTVVTTIAGGPTAGFTNGFGLAARFSSPQGICLDAAGNLYVADTGNNVVRKISPSGQVSTFAGTGVAGSQLGQSTNAQFNGPSSVCVNNAGVVYVADANNNRICKINTNGIVTSLAAISPLSQLEIDPGGNIYAGTWAAVDRATPGGSVIRWAGTGVNTINNWAAYVGVGLDTATNVYAATLTHIFKTAVDGTTTLYAGSAAGFTDGPALQALFQGPVDLGADSSTNLFVSDPFRIRKIRVDGWVSTLAGSGLPGYQDGPAPTARFTYPTGLCADTNGNVYVADSGNNSIRQISLDSFGIGIPDWWQLAHFGYVGIDPSADPDQDGMSNYAEFLAGTDPNDPNSVLRIIGASPTNGAVRISWNSVLGKSYLVQYSNNLMVWNSTGSPTPGSGGVITFTDPTAYAQYGVRFYRIAVANF